MRDGNVAYAAVAKPCIAVQACRCLAFEGYEKEQPGIQGPARGSFHLAYSKEAVQSHQSHKEYYASSKQADCQDF